MGECLANDNLQADSKVKFAAWPTCWRPPGTDLLLLSELVNFSELSHVALCHTLYQYILLTRNTNIIAVLYL